MIDVRIHTMDGDIRSRAWAVQSAKQIMATHTKIDLQINDNCEAEWDMPDRDLNEPELMDIGKLSMLASAYFLKREDFV